nr:MAG TPA: hypothetical protein [Caudoviricetes sp.]
MEQRDSYCQIWEVCLFTFYCVSKHPLSTLLRYIPIRPLQCPNGHRKGNL